MPEESKGVLPGSYNPSLSSSPTPRLYRSYLLRLWSTPEEGDSGCWRASLESPVTRELSYFPDLESLLAFLRLVTASTP
jgi:hypothetical protein